MVFYIKKHLRLKRISAKATLEQQNQAYEKQDAIASSLKKNLRALKEIFGDSGDFVTHHFLIRGERKATICYIDGLAKMEILNDVVLRPLVVESHLIEDMEPSKFASMDDIMSSYLAAAETKTEKKLTQVAFACSNGDAILFVENISEALIISAKGWEKRGISEPQTDSVIRGPREGFTESLRGNTAQIRRRLKTPDLRMEHMIIGARTRTQVCIAYIDKLVNPSLISEIKQRLNTINTDAILNSGYIEEFIEDGPLSVFHTISYTEKPDVIAGKLLEGRAAVVVDGTPFVLAMPMLFIENFQTAEDYAVRPYVAFLLRTVRLLSFFIGLTLPAAYVALVTFHPELIPTRLLFTIAAASFGLPFPAAVETAIMLVTFEFIKEAGVRLPKPVGQAISIVGALVMGQAATEAGLVGAPVVIVIALTAVTSFVSPSVYDAMSILRWFLLILAATLGGFGITMGLLLILIHLGSIKSFGADYLAPLAPLYPPDLVKDTLFRAPLWKMRTRPAVFRPRDRIRQKMSKPDFSSEILPRQGE